MSSARAPTAARPSPRRPPLDDARAAEPARIFKALGAPVRLRLLPMIASRGESGETCVRELTPAFDLSRPTI